MNIGTFSCTHLEVFFQFSVLVVFVFMLYVPYFLPESEGLGVEDLVSAPFSFSCSGLTAAAAEG